MSIGVPEILLEDIISFAEPEEDGMSYLLLSFSVSDAVFINISTYPGPRFCHRGLMPRLRLEYGRRRRWEYASGYGRALMN